MEASADAVGRTVPPPRRRPRRGLRAWGWWSAQQAGLLAVVIVLLSPLYMAIVTSLYPSGELGGTASMALPGEPTLANYELVWTDLGFDSMMVNSTILTLMSAFVATSLAALAAYGMARYRPLGGGAFRAVLFALMAVPPTVTMIPLFLLMVDLQQINEYPSAIVAEIGLLLPFATILLYSYMRDLPNEQFEAATLDGASASRQFLLIAVPLSRAALVANFVLAAVFVWNDLLIPLVMWQSPDLQTLMVGLSSLGPGRTGVRDTAVLMAGVVVAIGPLLLLFLLTRGAVAKGLIEGGER